MNIKTATFVTVLLAITSIMMIGMSKAPEIRNRLIEVDCLLPSGAVKTYETHDVQITNRAMFQFVATEGFEVTSSFCHVEKRVR